MNKSDSLALCESNAAWEKAFVEQFYYASVGQLFSGVLHNLNGVNQAFSLHSSLLRSMFSQAEELLQKIQYADGDQAKDYLDSLQKLLRQRAILADQMESKLEQGQSILTRCRALTALYDIIPEQGISLNRIIQYELDFLASLPFFKHRVKKNISLAENIPGIFKFQREIHTVFYVVILNAVEALEAENSPELTINSYFKNDTVIVDIINTGNTLDQGDDNIFKAFYSTKAGHAGLGLYIAESSIALLDGDIQVDCFSEMTKFTISFPIQ